MSWDERLASDYDVWSARMTDDVPFYLDLALRAEGSVVELAVGNGRVAIPIALATGQTVIGIDSSATMLDLARTAAAEAHVELDLREGDLSSFTLDEPAGLIYCPFHGLLHLPTWADRRRTFERVAHSLTPTGRFAWNALAFDFRVAAQFDGIPQSLPAPHITRFTIGTNRIDIVHDHGGTSTLWWATLNEWLGLLDVAGMELESLSGGFRGEPFDGTSTQYVVVARLRGERR